MITNLTVFTNQVEFGTILGAFGISKGGFEHPKFPSPPRYATAFNLLKLSGPSLAAHKANIQPRPDIRPHPKGACALDTAQL